MEAVEKFKELLHQEDLLQQVVDQLNKDLNPTIDFQWNAASNDPYKDFILEVRAFVKALMNGNQQSFMQRMYAVDIPESRLVKALEQPNQKSDHVTQLILDRVTQKVLTRKMFKKK